MTKQGKIRQHGLSLVELLLAVVIGGILLAGIDGLLGSALLTERQIRSRNDTLQQARFAMQPMLRAVSGSQRLLIPLVENPATAWSESVRDVLAVTLDPTLDRDKDGWADANNDKDYLDNNQNGSRDAGEPERIDEDPGSDTNNDGGVTGMIVSQLVKVQPLPCEKGKSRRKQGCPKKLPVATQQGNAVTESQCGI